MGCKILFALALIFFGCCLASGRVFYVDGQGNVPRESYGIPGYPADENEQASRDLDLSFSTGDPDETGLVYPVKKVRSPSRLDQRENGLGTDRLIGASDHL